MNNPTAYFRLNHPRETLQLFAQPFGFGGVVVLNGVLQKRVQPLDLLNRIVSLCHCHRPAQGLLCPNRYRSSCLQCHSPTGMAIRSFSGSPALRIATANSTALVCAHICKTRFLWMRTLHAGEIPSFELRYNMFVAGSRLFTERSRACPIIDHSIASSIFPCATGGKAFVYVDKSDVTPSKINAIAE